jgi:uncharacterized protein involved in outer membrane biogenesis
MSHWKKILLTSAVLVVLLIMAVNLFLLLYDFNRLKPTIARAVNDATGRELTIAGNIEFRFRPWPTLVVDGAGLQNASWGSTPDLARVKHLEVQINVWQLIFGKFDFSRLVLIEPNVIVEFNVTGASNFSFDTAGEETDELALSPPPLIFSQVLIENGLFTYKDAQSSFKLSIRIDRMTAEIPGFDKSLQIDFKGAYNDLPFTLNGTVGPIWAWVVPGYALPANITVAAGGATANVKGEMRDPTHLKDLAFSVNAEGPSIAGVAKLAGVADIPELGAFNVAAKVSDPQGILAVEDLNANIGTQDLVAVSITGNIENVLDLKGIKLDVAAQGRDAANLTQLGLPLLPGKNPFKVTADISDLAANLFRAGNLSIALGENEIHGPVTLDLAEKVPYLKAELASQKSELGPGSLDLKLIDPFGKAAITNLDLKLGTPELIQIRLNGTVDDLLGLQGVDINFEAQGKDLVNLKQLTGQPLPVRGTFSVAGNVLIPASKHLEIPNLKMTAGKNTITGSLDLDLRKAKPELTAVLSSPQLDLPSVLPPELAKQNWPAGLGQIRPVKLTVQLADFFRQIAVKKLDLQAGTLDSAEVRLHGSVDKLEPMQGVDLNFSVKGNALAKLKEILAQPYLFAPVPGQGSYAISGHIKDPAANNFEVRNFKLAIAENILTGWVNVNLAAQPPQYEVDVSTPKFNLKPFPIPEEAAYASLNKIDDLGPLKIHSKVAIEGDQLSLSQIELQAGKEQLAMLQVKGSIKNLTTQRGINLQFDIRGNEVANLDKITGRSIPLKGVYGLSGRLTDPAQKTFNIRDLVLRLGPNDISGRLDLKLSANQRELSTELVSPKFTLQPVTLPALETIARFEDLGPLKLTLDIAGAGDKIALNNLDLKVGGEEFLALVLDATVRDLRGMEGINLKFAISGQDISKLTAVVGPKIHSNYRFQVSGRVAETATKVHRLSDFAAVWGDSQSSGWIELDETGQRLLLKADLSSDKVDLRPFLGYLNSGTEAEAANKKKELPQGKKQEPKKTPSESEAKSKKVFSTAPLPLADLQKMDLDLKYRGNQVLFRSMALNDLAVDILLQNGSLAIKPLKFRIGGGIADGRINLQSGKKPAEFSTSLAIDQLGIGPMLDELGYPRNIEGNLDAVINLDGSGDSIAALMAGLNGDIRIVAKDGRVESKYLRLLERYLGSGFLQMINPFEKQNRYTPINCFVDSIKIDDGKADIKLLLDTDQTSIFGAGAINLKTEGLDLGIKPTPKKSALPVDISFSLNQLSQPFRLGGTLANPKLKVDPGQTAFLIGKLAGALALGPVGIAALFTDISLGKKDACAVALEKAEKKIEAEETKSGKEIPQKTGADKEKREDK